MATTGQRKRLLKAKIAVALHNELGRVPTLERTLALQQDALPEAGCERLFTDTASGSRTDRTGLAEALGFLRVTGRTPSSSGDSTGWAAPSDTSSTPSPCSRSGAIGFKSLQEQIDTTTSGGKLVFHVFGALAEFERDLIRERTQ